MKLAQTFSTYQQQPKWSHNHPRWQVVQKKFNSDFLWLSGRNRHPIRHTSRLLVLTPNLLKSQTPRKIISNIHVHTIPLVVLSHIGIHLCHTQIDRISWAASLLKNQSNQLPRPLGHTKPASKLQDTIRIKYNLLRFFCHNILTNETHFLSQHCLSKQ